MDLKETNHLLNSVDMNVVTPLERNNSDRRSIYDTLFSAEKDEASNTVDSNHTDVDTKERKFGNVSTLDWLQTWRSTKIS